MIFRLIPLIFLIAALALAFTCVILAIRSAKTIAQDLTGDRMPKTLQNAAFVALFLLMFGITSGILGAV